MSRFQSKRGLIIAMTVLAVVILVVSAFLLVNKSQQPSKVATPDISKQTTPAKDTATNTDAAKTDTTSGTTGPVADPATLNSIDIEPLAITVFYSKGTPGFEFTVLKTADQTQYIQFTSSDLIGTKCTNDQGAFASIIKNPSSNEIQTTTQTVKVGSDSYGLSLASTSCASNTDLLSKYQTGFKNGFSNLKAL
jgi:archaellin